MKVAVIGIGAISPSHINAILESGQEVVALCDVDVEKCQRAKVKFNIPNAAEYTDYKKMLDEVQLDSIHVCTPHYLHAEMICEGLRRNINVLSEKPLAINFEQLAAVEKAVEQSKAQLGVCFQNRYNASVRYLKEFLKGKEVIAGSATLVWCRNAEYYASAAWRGTWDQEGGGVMINQAIHTLDLLQDCCGMPETVIGQCTNNALRNEIEVEDTAYGLFSLKNGGCFVINATNASTVHFPIFSMFQTKTDTVVLCGDDVIINGEFLTKSDGKPLFGKDEWGVGHVKLIRDFYRCILSGEKFPLDFKEGEKAIRLVLKMYQSKGEKINVQ